VITSPVRRIVTIPTPGRFQEVMDHGTPSGLLGPMCKPIPSMGWSHPRFDRPRTTWDETDAEVTCEARNRRVDLLEPARADSWINSGSGNRTLSSHSSYMQTCKSSTSMVVTYDSHSVICRRATPAPALALERGRGLPRIGLGYSCLQGRKCLCISVCAHVSVSGPGIRLVLCGYVSLKRPPPRPAVLGRHFFSSSLPSPLLSTFSVRLTSKSVLHIPSPFLLFGEFRTTSEVQRPP
jgi:hypothetical protein